MCEWFGFSAVKGTVSVNKALPERLAIRIAKDPHILADLKNRTLLLRLTD